MAAATSSAAATNGAAAATLTAGVPSTALELGNDSTATESLHLVQDHPSQLHALIMDLCHAYFTSIGHLQNVAPHVPLSGADSARLGRECCSKEAAELSAQIVGVHREIDKVISMIEQDETSEAQQVENISSLCAEHEAVTEELRAEIASAQQCSLSVRSDLSELLREMAEMR